MTEQWLPFPSTQHRRQPSFVLVADDILEGFRAGMYCVLDVPRPEHHKVNLYQAYRMSQEEVISDGKIYGHDIKAHVRTPCTLSRSGLVSIQHSWHPASSCFLVPSNLHIPFSIAQWVTSVPVAEAWRHGTCPLHCIGLLQMFCAGGQVFPEILH